MGNRQAVARKATNISLDPGLVEEAKRLGVNLSRACERGLAAQIADERARRWLTENEGAIASYNDFVEQKGLLLAEYRQF